MWPRDGAILYFRRDWGHFSPPLLSGSHETGIRENWPSVMRTAVPPADRVSLSASQILGEARIVSLYQQG